MPIAITVFKDRGLKRQAMFVAQFHGNRVVQRMNIAHIISQLISRYGSFNACLTWTLSVQWAFPKHSYVHWAVTSNTIFFTSIHYTRLDCLLLLMKWISNNTERICTLILSFAKANILISFILCRWNGNCVWDKDCNSQQCVWGHANCDSGPSSPSSLKQ